jgi:hypothetical protein
MRWREIEAREAGRFVGVFGQMIGEREDTSPQSARNG